MTESQNYPKEVPAQKQDKHMGDEHEMKPQPQYSAPWYKGSGKLKDKVAIITGGDSGIGRAISILYAREGAKLVISYLNEDIDAIETEKCVINEGSQCLLIKSDLRKKNNCCQLIKDTIDKYGAIDILVNNCGEQHCHEDIKDINDEELMSTFETKFFSMFWITQYALEYMKEGSCIINTSSVTAYSGMPLLIDYTATNGAIVSFTRALALQLASKKIRVNSVAPGPIWTPLIPSTFGKDISSKKVSEFGKDVPMKRPGQPEEVAPSYVFLASKDASYFTGQTLHPNGGKIVNA